MDLATQWHTNQTESQQIKSNVDNNNKQQQQQHLLHTIQY